jgi:hypothetical protein
MPYLQSKPPVAEGEPPVHMQLKGEREALPTWIREKQELDAKKQALNDKFEQLRQNILGNVPLAIEERATAEPGTTGCFGRLPVAAV